MTTIQLATYGVYLVGAVTFILALKFLASPKTARTGNLLGAAGMILVVAWTIATTEGLLDNWWVLAGGRAPRRRDRRASARAGCR